MLFRADRENIACQFWGKSAKGTLFPHKILVFRNPDYGPVNDVSTTFPTIDAIQSFARYKVLDGVS